MRIVSKLTPLRQKGDTIIEVLIAISIIGFILGGAYVTSNNSLLATRDAQEHGAALQLLQTEVELLKEVTDSNPNAIFGAVAPNPFCISTSSTVISSPVSSPPAACKMDGDAQPTAAQPQYVVSISHGACPGATCNTFIAKTSWPSIQGRVTDQEQLDYRLYQ
jgi:prepilin-type N-terminal cleavage/methylation domain-containing protein